MQPSRAISGVDATWFWAGLLSMTVFWLIMAIMEITKPGAWVLRAKRTACLCADARARAGYCILAVLGVAFSGGNAWGYFLCRRWGKAELAAMRTGGMASAIQDMTSSIASGFLVRAL